MKSVRPELGPVGPKLGPVRPNWERCATLRSFDGSRKGVGRRHRLWRRHGMWPPDGLLANDDLRRSEAAPIELPEAQPLELPPAGSAPNRGLPTCRETLAGATPRISKSWRPTSSRGGGTPRRWSLAPPEPEALSRVPPRVCLGGRLRRRCRWHAAATMLSCCCEVAAMSRPCRCNVAGTLLLLLCCSHVAEVSLPSRCPSRHPF